MAVYTRTPKNGNDIASITEAITYGKAAVAAATKVCPKALSAYKNALTEAETLYVQKIAGTPFESQYLPRLRTLFSGADSLCDANKVKITTKPPSSTPPSSTPPVAPLPEESKSNTWLWLLGLVVVSIGGYLLYQKYGKKTLKRRKKSPRKQITSRKRKTTKRAIKRTKRYA